MTPDNQLDAILNEVENAIQTYHASAPERAAMGVMLVRMKSALQATDGWVDPETRRRVCEIERLLDRVIWELFPEVRGRA